MRKNYQRIRFAERQKIEEMCRQNKSVVKIAQEVGTSRDTIYEEFKRSGMTRANYNAQAAQNAI